MPAKSRRFSATDSTFEWTYEPDILKETNPWEVCNYYVKKHTDELHESWKRELDTLLVFAGLFSAVVTTFVVESYKSIEDDTTDLLLRTIVLQLNNMTNPQFGAPIDFNPRLESGKRVNTLWFLSLALSLSAALIGILCNQWIREYSRKANLPHREHIALHHMRYEGMKKGHVFNILRALPLLLIGALVLFFLGFVELLWESDKTGASLVAVVVGITMLFLLVTTILPALQSIYICAFPNIHFAQSPYKSPQSWIVYRIASFFSYFILRLQSGSGQRGAERPKGSSDMFQSQNWLDYERFLRRRRDAGTKPGARDVGLGLAWIGETFFQHQDVVEAVSRCLRDLNPSIGLEASLARMDCRRAASVRRARDCVQLWLPSTAPRDSELGRAKIELTRDLIVSHTLEHFAEKIEQKHMDFPLLHQRVALFLRINESEFMDQDVDCPVNRDNASLIRRESRERMLQCISTMLKKDLNCNATHTNGAFEIIRSLLLENHSNDPLRVMTDFLKELMKWIVRQPASLATGEKPQRRLKQGIIFHELIFFCKGANDRGVVDGFRQQLDEYIESSFGRELDAMEWPMKALDFPYLSRYIAWQKLN